MPEITPKTLSRFWSKVNKINNCWEWTANTRNGYGRFKIDGKLVTAHRLSYELTHGIIPKDYEIDHLCRNKKCVNPDHLEAVTKKVNILRGIGPTAINNRKIHCVKGHLLSGDNLGIRDDGNRRCKTCRKNWKPTSEAYELQKQRQKSRKYKDRQKLLLLQRRKKLKIQNDLFATERFG